MISRRTLIAGVVSSFTAVTQASCLAVLTWSVVAGCVGEAAAGNETNNGQGNDGNNEGGNADPGVDKDKSNAAGESGAEANANPRTGDAVRVTGSTIEVRHRIGIEEKIRNGRYLMRDKRGRSIVNRPATDEDLNRLRSFRDDASHANGNPRGS